MSSARSKLDRPRRRLGGAYRRGYEDGVAAVKADLSASEPAKPYGYVVELVGLHEGKEIYVYRSRCQPRLSVAEACVAHWATIYDNSRWRFKIVPLYAALSAQVQDVAGAVIRVGTYGKAYDRPEERRAYTYEHQPGNIEAHKLGRACSEIHTGGDWIDRGLNLLNALQREGFGVYELPTAPAKQEGGADEC